MKYANYDNTGYIIGFYDDQIHKKIPENSAKITEEQWLKAINYEGEYWINTETKAFEKAEPKKIPSNIALNYVRNVRNTKLSENDISFRKALENFLINFSKKPEVGNELVELLSVINTAKSLRDHPKNINLKSEVTVNELDSLLP